MTQLSDRLVIYDRRRTSDGFMAVRAKAARTGIYDYLASEVAAPADRFKPTDRVRVYRDAGEVFAKDAVASFIARAVTNDHPREAVTAANWKDHARGVVMGAMRDGEYLAFDLVLMDQALIADVEAGKRELSNGYGCTLDWTPGTAPDGQAYDARQTQIRGNHVAVVDAGRAGPDCAIADGQGFALCDANLAALDAASIKEKTTVPRTILIDGVPVNLSDEAAVEAVINRSAQQLADANTALADANAKIATLEGAAAAHAQQLADAKALSSPEAIDKAVAARASLTDKAKALVAGLVIDGKTDAAIRREVVTAKLGDAAKDMSDAQIEGAFSVLTADEKATAPAPGNPGIGLPQPLADGRNVVEMVRAARY